MNQWGGASQTPGKNPKFLETWELSRPKSVAGPMELL
jgi:hypothetical protein